MADATTNAYQYQHNSQLPSSQSQSAQSSPPPPPPSAYYDNVPNEGAQQGQQAPLWQHQQQQQQQQQKQFQSQYNQPPPFHKPNINIQPLIETDHQALGKQGEFPNVEFSGGGRANLSGNSNSASPMMSNYAINDNEDDPYASLSSSTRRANLRYQLFLDRISPHWKARWVFSLLALGVFLARVILSQGWYVICYGLGIYYLNLLIGFISPRVDPSLAADDDDDDAGPMLPTNASDEFKPFIRRVPEFKFWISGTKATLLALFMTLFDIFDVPVFWPILLIYFIVLFACTMRQQIKHMIRYSYVPWDSGKKKYVGRGGGVGGGGSGGADDNEPTTI